MYITLLAVTGHPLVLIFQSLRNVSIVRDTMSCKQTKRTV